MILAPESHAANPSVPANYQEYTQLDIGDILSDGTKAPIQEMLNSKIFVKGKVLKSPQLKDDEIVIYRMIITCCAADALPSGILVKLPEKNQFHDEDWIGVEGTIQLLPFNDNIKSIEPIADMAPQGNAYPYFTATKAYKISVPSSEYLYY
jgi:Predicted membrane protein